MLRQILRNRPVTILVIAGVPIRLQISAFGLPLWAAGVGALSNSAHWHGAAFMLMLVCGIYVCGALHEFGHIIVARHFGLPVVGLRVSGMGGFVQVDGGAGILPRHDLLIALGGLVVSALLSVCLAAIAWWAAGPRLLAALPALLARYDSLALLVTVAAANVLLTLFNLLPFFPMDGGRALSAGLALFLAPATASRLVATFGLITSVVVTPFALVFVGNPGLRLLSTLTAGFIFIVSYRLRRV